MVQRNMAPDQALIAKMRPPAGPQVRIVLQPVSHPELAPIQIDETLFPVGRTEAPFDGYAPEIVAELSRRHARVFCEDGAVYLADLDSKNGTTVNGVAVQHAIIRLHDGDELGFGHALSYRVQLQAGAPVASRAAKLISLTLSPERGELGLQPIVITQFPFLVSKTDTAFARYKDANPQQVNYLSRRHAHIFLKRGVPYVEDLGSTNGTFVAGARLDEHAVALNEGDLLAFGGHHFVYRVGMQWEENALDPTVTRLGVAVPGAAPTAADAEKTTFVAAADSFLDIFCVDAAPVQDDELNDAAAPASGTAVQEADTAGSRGKVATFVSGLATALGGGHAGVQRAMRCIMGALAVAGILAWLLIQSGAPERELQDLLASGDYARAAAVASASLARDPDNTALKSMGTEAVLKANVPNWVAAMKARQFARASAIVAAMRDLSNNNPELQPLVGELAWIGNLEQFVDARRGADAPVRSPADAARIKLILKQWEDEAQAHQRAFATISSYVPEFRDAYAEALSHVRKLALSGGRAEHEPATP
jgi:pSer/pThr/pTyr-binding forkhead associated (FHA) protein